MSIVACGTAGGDRLIVPYLVSTAVASHPTVNCLFNAAVSEDAHFGTVDLTDFYLGTSNPNPPFIKIYLDPYPPEVLSRLRLAPFTKPTGGPIAPTVSSAPTRPSMVSRSLGSCQTTVW